MMRRALGTFAAWELLCALVCIDGFVRVPGSGGLGARRSVEMGSENKWRFPTIPARRQNVTGSAEAAAAEASGGDLSALIGELPVVRELQRQLPEIGAGREGAVDSSELIGAFSRLAEQALRGNESSPLEWARGMLSVATGAAAGLAREAEEARQPAQAQEAELQSLATALLQEGYFDAATGVSSLFPAEADVSRVDLVRDGTFLGRAARASELSSAAYANDGAAAAFRALGCSRVASGSTCDVAWHVVDSLGDDGGLERHLVIRGFDASDESNDRFELVKRIVWAREAKIPRSHASLPRDWETFERDFDAFAEAPPGGAVDGVLAHAGFLFMAERILDDAAPFLDVAPSHRLVLCGHSIGGALSTILAVLLAKRADDPRFPTHERLETFTFAALPCLRVADDVVVLARTVSSPQDLLFPRSGAAAPKKAPTSTLAALGLKPDSVNAFVQPWDPLVRWYSDGDPCYPLIADMGDDGYTIFASGPARVLRPLARAIFQQAKEWPQFRDVYRAEANGTFAPTGVQYLIMPDETRYLADRIFSLIVDVPEPAALVKVDPTNLPLALDAAFPLDDFSISLLPAALRSFVHHFHPAYSLPLLALLEGAEAGEVDATPTTKADALYDVRPGNPPPGLSRSNSR